MHIVIIGAGVLGCATARLLSYAVPHHKITVLDAAEIPGSQTSRWNSGVIHAGMHLKPSSLKARFAREGRNLVISYCEKNEISFSQRGMIIAATVWDALRIFEQAPEFLRILRNAKRLSVHVELVTGRHIQRLEPSVRAVAGLFVREVGIIDQRAFVASLYREALAFGAQFHFKEKVEKLIRLRDSGFIVKTQKGEWQANLLINVAGPHAAQIASLAGYAPQVSFVRGEYVTAGKAHEYGITHLVYPIPRAGEGGLGVHLTPTTSGNLLIGPNAIPVLDPDDLGHRVARWSVEDFRDRVRPLWRPAKTAPLTLSGAGIRCKSSLGDFLFQVSKRELHAIGYESPGLTAALSAAQHIVEKLTDVL